MIDYLPAVFPILGNRPLTSLVANDPTAAASNAAIINAALQSACPVIIPDGGPYYVTQVNMQPGCWLKGAGGRGGSILQTTQVDNQNVVEARLVNDWKISDLKLVGPGAVLNHQAGLWIAGCDNAVVRDVWIDSATHVGLLNTYDGGTTPSSRIQFQDILVSNTYKSSASAGGVAVWNFFGACYCTFDGIIVDTCDGTGFALDSGTSTGGAMLVHHNAIGTLIVKHPCQGYGDSGLLLEGAQHNAFDAVVIDTPAAAYSSRGVSIRQDQNGLSYISAHNSFGSITTYDTPVEALAFDGAQFNTVGILRAHNVGLLVGAGTIYALVFQASSVLAGETRSDVNDNSVGLFDMSQDAGAGVYSYGVLFDGSVVNCRRNRVLTARLGSPATDLAQYSGANAPVVGADANYVGHNAWSPVPVPSSAAGAQAGAGAPAPLQVNVCTDMAGRLSWGTGTGSAAGEQVKVSYGKAFWNPPNVMLTPLNAATAALGLYVSSLGTAGFSISCANAPADGQGNGTYAAEYSIREPNQT